MPLIKNKLFLSPVLGLFFSSYIYAGTPPALKGDVNNDGSVGSADVQILRDKLAAEITVPPYYSKAADVDEDNLVDYYDLYRLEKFLDSRESHLGWDVRYPVREFELDTLGNSLDTGGFAAADYPAQLTELKEGQVINDWSVEVSLHGASRQSCSPVPLNIMFPKRHPVSRARQAGFKGFSSYNAAISPERDDVVRELEYRRFRTVSECDVWDRSGEKINVMLREYFNFCLLRILKVPAMDPIAFAHLSKITAPFTRSMDYSDFPQPARFMFLQRDDDDDDQIPFPQQHGLEPDVLEDDEAYSWNQEGEYSSPDLETMKYWTNGNPGEPMQEHVMRFDIDNTVRYRLGMFLGDIQDRGAFHNEDYGYNAATQRWKIIPFDFDASLYNLSFSGPGNFRGGNPTVMPYATRPRAIFSTNPRT